MARCFLTPQPVNRVLYPQDRFREGAVFCRAQVGERGVYKVFLDLRFLCEKLRFLCLFSPIVRVDVVRNPVEQKFCLRDVEIADILINIRAAVGRRRVVLERPLKTRVDRRGFLQLF